MSAFLAVGLWKETIPWIPGKAIIGGIVCLLLGVLFKFSS